MGKESLVAHTDGFCLSTPWFTDSHDSRLGSFAIYLRAVLVIAST
jgi:hypothetical protein